jgi:RHS repeat-associated protein
MVKIVESVSGSVTNTKQFLWGRYEMCEARDASSSLVNQYFDHGQTISGNNYHYSCDHLWSVRELTDSTGALQAQYSYDLNGKVTRLQGSLTSDFQYAGYYFHTTSGLSMAVYRAYSSVLGRWFSRDPIEESGGLNQYAYVLNQPIRRSDPLGLACASYTVTPLKPVNPVRTAKAKPVTWPFSFAFCALVAVAVSHELAAHHA